MKLRRWALAALLVSVVSPATGWAQRRYSDPPAAPAPAAQPPVLPDPTQASKRMQDRLDENRPADAVSQKMPALAIKGRVINRGRPASALIEIDGRLCTVTKGTALMLGGAQVLTFVEVSAHEIRIEMNSPKQTISLN